MGLVFRAIWQDAVPDPLDFGLDSFRVWVRGKHGIDVVDEGTAVAEGGAADVRVDRVASDQVTALRATLHEERQVQRWTTTLTVIASPSEEAWFWVDLELVAQDAFRLPDVDSPRLVRNLLDRGVNPHRGSMGLGTKERLWRPSGLRDLIGVILDPVRDVPLVVFTPDPEGGIDLAQRRASSAATLLAGVATVELLSTTSVRDFGDMIGIPLGVWGGACRIYLPGAGPADLPYRHFFITPRTMGADVREAGRIVLRRLSASIAARRAPTSYMSVRAALARKQGSESLEALETAYLEVIEDQEQLRREKLGEEDLRVEAIADAEDANEKVADLQRQLEAYRRMVIKAGLSEKVWSEATTVLDLPASAESCVEAADQAQRYLDRVVLPDAARATTHELDQGIESRSRGQKSWWALRALQAYAIEAADHSGFWDWCEHSGNAYAWPASSKKTAMTESEGVTSSREMREERVFEVSRDVDPTGRVLMKAHLKIDQGGGPLAARVYFYDDTKGRTRKVHVGFFGPHRYVRNLSTN